MRNVVKRLDAACRRANLPIFGVSMGHEEDRTTWRIHYEPAATPRHRTTGAMILNTFDPNNDPLGDQEERLNRGAQIMEKAATQAMLRLLARRFGVSLVVLKNEFQQDLDANKNGRGGGYAFRREVRSSA